MQASNFGGTIDQLFLCNWEREAHTQQVSDEGTYLREPVFFPFSSDVSLSLAIYLSISS